MFKTRLIAISLLVASVLVGYFAVQVKDTKFPYKFGLDIAGGTHLVYRADTSQIDSTEISDSMSALRDVIEKRTNLFGVSEPLVQTEEGSSLEGNQKEHRLIVELPGVTDISQAIEMIGQTPLLEFKLAQEISSENLETATSTEEQEPQVVFIDTGISGRVIERAQLEFNPTSGEPAVSLTFNSEGKDLFAKVTSENVGQILAIFLDNQVISTPVIREEIRDGKAQISGGFTPQEAKILVRDINYGALPLPIELISTQSIGASIGTETLDKGVHVALYGLLVVIIFLILWYRLPGLLAAISLLIYISLVLSVFKLIPITLTSAGIAGFILSIGMAVDANILIFERLKEELKSGRDIDSAVREGFSRAWLSIRDSNISSIITAIILFWFGTSLVEGFALTFGLGVLISMLTAITITRSFLLAISPKQDTKFKKKLFNSGINFSDF
ncbi:MAG: protein translocase subunit SecD [Patescibacteria group bacterium]|nr:protein translocase subunit SecD [Patescibacteria group bacterium]